MKFHSATTVALTALLQAANANFDIYMAGIGGNGISGNDWGFQVYDDPPGCKNTIDWIWRQSDDVSGGKYGVRCEGSGGGCSASGDPSDIQEMELNFNGDGYHWTIYANRNWGLFDLKDKKVGNCMPFPDDDFTCGAGLGMVEGDRKIRCLINSVNSEDINSNRPR